MNLNQKIKRVSSVLLTVFILCSLTACGKQKSNLQIVEQLEQEPQYLSFFSGKNYGQSDLGKYWSDRFVDIYNQQVYVNYDGAAYYADENLSYRELLERRMESASPDDLYIISAEDVLEFEKKGYWMDLSNMDFVNNLSDAALYQSTYNGKVFSVPLTFTGFGFLWNVTMLQECGLSVPENLEEFMGVCEKLKTEGILPYGANKGYALTVPAMCRGLSGLYGSPDQEQKIEALNSGEMPISNYMSDGFEYLEEMIEKGYLDPQQAMNAEPRKEDIQLFKDGGCAFICIEMGAILETDETFSYEMEFTGLPLLEDGCVAVYGADSRLCVNPKTQNMDTVLKFIEMVGTQEALDESAVWQKKLSSAKDSKIEIKPMQKNMFELLQQPGQIPNQDFSLHFNTWESIRDRGREICNGASAAEACANLDELQRKDLEAYSEGNSE